VSQLTGHGFEENDGERPGGGHGELVDKGARSVGHAHRQRISSPAAHQEPQSNSQSCAKAQRSSRHVREAQQLRCA
jgi:hypothetical protein